MPLLYFRSLREKSCVTLFFDHPVLYFISSIKSSLCYIRCATSQSSMLAKETELRKGFREKVFSKSWHCQKRGADTCPDCFGGFDLVYRGQLKCIMNPPKWLLFPIWYTRQFPVNTRSLTLKRGSWWLNFALFWPVIFSQCWCLLVIFNFKNHSLICHNMTYQWMIFNDTTLNKQ